MKSNCETSYTKFLAKRRIPKRFGFLFQDLDRTICDFIDYYGNGRPFHVRPEKAGIIQSHEGLYRAELFYDGWDFPFVSTWLRTGIPVVSLPQATLEQRVDRPG